MNGIKGMDSFPLDIQITMDKPYKCNSCEASFKHPGGLATHKYRQHKGEKTLKGQGTNLRIYPKTSNDIVNEHLDNNRHLYDDEAFNRLKKRASGEEGVPYKYSKPNLPNDELPEFSKPKAPKKMQKPPRKDKGVKCKLCSARFPNERDHARHMAETHPTCVECRKRFHTREEYEQHEHPHCRICRRIFTSDLALEAHLMTHPKCQQCGETFLDENRRRIHWTSRHRRPSPDSVDSDDSKVSWDQPKRPRHDHDSDESEATISVGKEIVHYDSEASNEDVDDSDDVPSDASDASDASTLSANDEVVPYPRDDRDSGEVEPYDASSDELTADEQDAADIDNTSDATLSAHDEVMPYVGVFSDLESPEPEDVRIFPCPDCHRHFETQEVLNRHYRDKHNRSKNKHKQPARQGSPIDQEVAGPSNVKVYQCTICKDILKTKKGYLHHMKSHRYDCKMCAARFDTVDDRDKHMSLEHPWCRICDQAFTNLDEYLRHKVRLHPENYDRYDGHLPSESEDAMNSDEDDIDLEDRQFHKHINCVTIDKFMEIKDLINQNRFDTLVGDDELLAALQTIFKGVIKGYIPICSSQRLVLTKPMKKLMFSFGTNPSGTLLMRNKSNLKQLFSILWDSVSTVVNSVMKYGK